MTITKKKWKSIHNIKIKANIKFGFQTIVLNYNDRFEIGTGNETITNNKKLDFTIYLKWNTKTK